MDISRLGRKIDILTANVAKGFTTVYTDLKTIDNKIDILIQGVENLNEGTKGSLKVLRCNFETISAKLYEVRTQLRRIKK